MLVSGNIAGRAPSCGAARGGRALPPPPRRRHSPRLGRHPSLGCGGTQRAGDAAPPPRPWTLAPPARGPAAPGAGCNPPRKPGQGTKRRPCLLATAPGDCSGERGGGAGAPPPARPSPPGAKVVKAAGIGCGIRGECTSTKRRQVLARVSIDLPPGDKFRYCL